MSNAVTVKSPRHAHELACAMGKDAANAQMRKAGRSVWNCQDYNLAAATTQEWYRHFDLLNADQWMPDGMMWSQVDGEWVPVPVKKSA